MILKQRGCKNYRRSVNFPALTDIECYPLFLFFWAPRLQILHQTLNYFYSMWPFHRYPTLCIATLRTTQSGSKEWLLWFGHARLQQVKITKQAVEQWWNKPRKFNNNICHHCPLVLKSRKRKIPLIKRSRCLKHTQQHTNKYPGKCS